MTLVKLRKRRPKKDAFEWFVMRTIQQPKEEMDCIDEVNDNAEGYCINDRS